MRTRSNILIALAWMAWAVLTSAPAIAQEGGNAARVQSLIDEGVAMRRAGDDVGALSRFEAAFALTRSARARAQIALVEQALGRWIDAEAHLLEALGSHEPWIEERRVTLEGQLEVIRSHLGRVQLVGGVRGARVTLDEQPVGSLPINSALWVEPGPVVVEVRADGYLLFRETIETTEGQLTTLRVELVPEPAATVEPSIQDPVIVPTPPRDGGPPLDILGWSAISVGGATLVLSAVTLVLRNGEAETFNGPACLQGGLSRGENCRGNHDAAMMWESVSIATLVLGIVFVGAGTALVAVDASGGSETEPASLACSPISGTTWGLGCVGTF